MDVRATLAVFRFEFRRALTPVRLAFWLGLACFPPALMALIQYQAGPSLSASLVTFILFVLIPEVVCLMGLLLWATPAIHAELEGRTWSYLAIRSGGKGSVLLGKYLAAVVWTALAAWLAISVSMLFAAPMGNILRLWTVLTVLVLFSSLAYGALYVLLGVVFLRRAMMITVGYTLIFEMLVGFIPAIINQFTVQYHLRGMLARWLPMDNLPGIWGGLFQRTAPAGQHIFILLAATVGLLTVAVAILHRRELVRADDN
ncbi:MAG TPA: hypothetical protein VMY42_15585 [Thermoguttaceae bacterium]|nr:hypothetical protein [Thermoguttaceae bacterium]